MKDYVNQAAPKQENKIVTMIFFSIAMFGMFMFLGVVTIATVSTASDNTVNAGIAGAVMFVIGTIAGWNRKT